MAIQSPTAEPETRTPTTAGPDPAVISPDRLYRMPLEVYHRMAGQGLLTPRDKVVLLDGLLVTKRTRGERHVVATNLAWDALRRLVPEGWTVLKRDPIALPGGPGGLDSEPEPDLAVVVGGIRDYVTRKPGPGDVALVVEVADGSPREDRLGLARCVRAGIPAAWLVNLNEGVVEVYTDPDGTAAGGYRGKSVYGPEARVPVVIGGREVGPLVVSDLLP